MTWKIAVIVAGIAALLYLGYRFTLGGGGEVSPGNNASFPDGIHYLCGEEDCAQEFTITVAELADHHSENYGQPYPCPKCKADKTIRAERCLHCSRHFPASQSGEARPCPHCKKKRTDPQS